MLRTRRCAECEETKTNCVEVGLDSNWVCLDCLAFILDQNNFGFKKRKYEVKMNLEKIDPKNVPF